MHRLMTLSMQAKGKLKNITKENKKAGSLLLGRLNYNINGGDLVSWVDKLVIEYEQGKESLQRMKGNLGDSEVDKLDRTQINGMINEITDVIRWLKTGRDPFAIRGIDKRSAYQKRVLYDMDLFPSLDILPDSIKEKERELTNEEKELVADILLILSPRERTCFLMHHVNLLSFDKIAQELGLSKSTVQSYIQRARNKINNKVSCRTMQYVAN